ncbi:MAG: amidase [Rhodobacteraceae bacterium]|nr:amidase [Paracoccaceae bacterium]
MSETALQVNNLSAGYDKIPILHDIEFSVAENEVVGILGHNGMGKTTLLKTIMGFISPSSGSILLHSNDVTRSQPFERSRLGLGYVPQGRGIFPQLTVRENLAFAWHPYDDETEEDVADSVLDYFPRLKSLLSRAGGNLSGGEQQLLTLARCLMGDPDFLLLDEPTEGIQPSIIDEMIDTLLLVRKKRGLSILLVEQNFEFISYLSERVLVLERGIITGELNRNELKDNNKLNQFLGFGTIRPSSEQNDSIQDDTIALSQDSKTYTARNSDEFTNNLGMKMTINRPTLGQLREMANRFNMNLSDDELSEYSEIMDPYIQAYDRLDASPDYLPMVKYPRSPGYFPDSSENQLNAWYIKTDIKGAGDGPLHGRKIALKDTICLAGVPMMNGSSIMEGYIPEIDATIVTRMLDAGATIAGKAHCENFCLSGGSHTGAKGPIHNPWKRGYMAGGSSGGSAALVAAGEVDMAIAGDQGGSIRIPSSNCGVYGMKPTHGLVPYTGVMPIEQTIDHVGPVTNNVADNAILLEVLAGEDGLDPRQYGPQVYQYTHMLGKGIGNMKIGLLKEGFGRPESEADVDSKVSSGADRFRELGAIVDEISIPEHLLALDCWTSIAVEGLQDHMMRGNSAGTNYQGLYLPSMIDHMAQWRNRADELSPSLKVCMFLGEYFQEQYRGRFYGKAQNLRRKVGLAYSRVLSQYDLLLMPTVPMKPQEIPPPDCSISLYAQRAFEMIGNTAPFNFGLPAMNVPCGLSDGLPIGLMLVGNRFTESKIYQAAHAFEQSGDWRKM